MNAKWLLFFIPVVLSACSVFSSTDGLSEPAPTDPTTTWLDSHHAGWCLDDYNKLINLCGKVSVCKYTLCGEFDTDPAGSPSCYADEQHEHANTVPFCCDARFLKPYPNGLTIDIGFFYDGVSTGYAVALGGDVQGKSLNLQFISPGVIEASTNLSPILHATLERGYHLFSYQVSTTKSALLVNGKLAAQGPGTAQPIELATDHGPGMILGSRISYWWEKEMPILRFAPFFFHLRDEATPGSWKLEEATKAGPKTLLLLDESGVSGPSEWTATVGPQKAYGVDRTFIGPGPTWSNDVDKTCLRP